jgi:Transglycosylase-like domain
MARASAFVAGMLCGLALGTAVIVSHAADPQTDVVEAAAAANVDPRDLAAAVATVGVAQPDVTPWSYLRSTGELPPLPPPRPPAASIWDLLASCESSGNWASASNPRYKGGLQQDADFWARYGGLAYADRPDHATRAQQITVAERGQKVQGWAAWPVCSRRLGLR